MRSAVAARPTASRATLARDRARPAGLLGAWAPARRAVSVDPIVALRCG